MKLRILLLFFLSLVFTLSFYAQSESVVLAPQYVNISSSTVQGAVLLNVNSYPDNTARYRLYNSSHQYNCWDEESNSFISSNTYADNPLIPGDESTTEGATWWIIYERGSNNSTSANFRTRRSPYTSNYRTLYDAVNGTGMTSIFSLTGTVTGSDTYPLTKKYVVLGFDATTDGNLLSVVSTDLTTGNYNLKCDGSTVIKRVEFRTIDNVYLTSITNSSGWNSTTDLGNVDFPGGSVTIPDAPVATSATDITHESFTANWNASSGATKYFLDVSTSSDFSSFVAGYDNKDVGNVTSSTVTSLNSSTTYFYRVRANNSAGTSSNSNTISVTTIATPATTVQFKNSSASVLETSGSYNLVVTISHPSVTVATTADVVLISGDPADIDNYTTQTVTFPASSSADQTVVITITDDGITEGDETLTFELQNVSGGNSASVGTPSQFDLTITESNEGDYYASIDPNATGSELKFELHNLIKGHIEYPYSSSSTDVWDIVMDADEDPDNSNNVILIYTGRSQDKSFNSSTSGSSDAWNREHVWAKSRGDFGTDPGPGTDCHHLKPADASMNSTRSNKDFDNGGTQVNDGGTPTDCYTDADSWEPRDEVKGDVARMIFYMAVRYEGEKGEPDLHIVDYTEENPDKDPQIGKLSTLLEWNQDDPVDAFELHRNDVVYSYQQNRNPFIDHPEWVDEIWGTAAPLSPTITNVTRDVRIPDADQNIVVSADVTDNGSVSTVLLKYTVDNGTEQSVTMTLSGGDTYTGTIPESAYNNGNYLSYYVYAVDDEGNPTYGTVNDLLTGTTPISIVHSGDSNGRLDYDGVLVRVQGVATVSSGVYSTSNLDVFVQDATQGVAIYKQSDNTTTITEGNEYLIIGNIEQYKGKTEIVPENSSTDITDLGAGTVVVPRIITISELLANAEQKEGILVMLENVTKVSGTWAAGQNIEVSDDGGTTTLSLHIDSSTDLGDNPEPNWPVNIVGMFSQYDDYYPYTSDYQIVPRRITDFKNFVLLETKIFLQGAFNSSTNMMRTDINSNIPKTSPYVENKRTIDNIPADVVDWILLELRETPAGNAVVSKSVFLHKNGKAVTDNASSEIINLTAPDNDYYLVIKHRNHLPVMSATTINLNKSSSTFYDFTTGSEQFYGNGGAIQLK